MLLDTQILLWCAYAPARLPRAARQRIESREVALCFSMASLWEVALKSSLGRAGFTFRPEELHRHLLRHDFSCLGIEISHLRQLVTLPRLHGDPFDRLLLVQARCEGLPLLTTDRELAAYGNDVQLV